MLKGLKTSSSACKWIFYRSELNAKGELPGIEF